MAERTVIAGSVTKSYGMIGWRVGWIVGPEEFMNDAARTHIYNTTIPGGIGQAGALAALESDFEPSEYVPTLQERRDVVTEQLREIGVTTIPSKGGWMQLMNVEELRYDSATSSDLLLEESNVADEGLHLDVSRGGEKVDTVSETGPIPPAVGFTTAEEHLAEHAERYLKRFKEWHPTDL